MKQNLKNATVAILKDAIATYNKAYGTAFKSDLINQLEAVHMASSDTKQREIVGCLLQGLRLAKRGNFNFAARNAIRALSHMEGDRTMLIDQFCNTAGITRL